ncbi:MAG: UbiA family prenyltransferase [Thermoplasmata archaeon]|nr:UbiA family prenyltransferase [Thermoplasmata archaeon]
MKVKAFYDLTRLDHGIMFGIAVIIGAILGGATSLQKCILGFLTALFMEVGTFSLNDYFDYEVDLKNKRMDRPLVRGDLKKGDALIIAGIAIPIGVATALFINKICFFIALINALLAILYDAKLKEIKIIGNFYIAFTMAIPFIFGSAIGQIKTIVYFFSFLAFFAGAGREILKDVMDFEGDKIRKTKSFPFYLGIKKANLLASFFILIAMVASVIPFFFNIDERYYNNPVFLIPLLVSLSIFSYSIFLLFKYKNELARKTTLVAMLFGLIAFLMPLAIKFIK